MTSVTEQAIELGATAIRRAGDMRNNSSKLIEESNRQALAAARTQWPILSAGLRELHAENRYRTRDGVIYQECYECGEGKSWPCPTERWRRSIDKELGIDD